VKGTSNHKTSVLDESSSPLGSSGGACLTAPCVAALATTETSGDIRRTVEVHPNAATYHNRARISLERAIEIASRPDEGKTVEAELEVEDGYLVYDVVFVNPDGRSTEYVVDAGNGKILISEPDDDLSRGIRGKFEEIRISLIEAIKATRSLSPGIVTEIELEQKRGRLSYAIMTWEMSGKSHVLRIDATSGDLIK
jgi:uncharacterized membrane protein YkoI